MGDSHAIHWLPALYEAAEVHNWTVTGLFKGSCLPANVTVEISYKGKAGRPFTECQSWLNKAFAWILDARPDAVVMSASPRYRLPGRKVDASKLDLAKGVVQVAQAIKASGIPVLAIKDTPFHREAVPTCLARASTRGLGLTESMVACSSKAAKVLFEDSAVNYAALQYDGLQLLDFDDAFVDANGTCPPIIGNVIVYRDSHHMTATYAATLAPAPSRRLRAALPDIL
jgi:hypothetical protein